MAPISKNRLAFMEVFREERTPSGFLQRMFKVRKGNRSRTSKVNIDIQRFGEDVAVAIKPGTGGPDIIDVGLWDTKDFEPANYNPGTIISTDDLEDRFPGENPFDEPDFVKALAKRTMQTAVKLSESTVRAAERQAADCLTRGKIDLIDRDGNNVYSVDYSPKATHFPTVSLAWSNIAADIPNDIRSLAKTIRDDSGIDSNLIVMTGVGFEDFIRNTLVKERLNFRHAEIVSLNQQLMGAGSTFQGIISVGSYRFEIWTYDATFKHEQTGVTTQFIPDDKVVMTSSMTRLDRLSSRPARPLGSDPTLRQFNPGRFQAEEYDVEPILWTPPNRRSLNLELATRTLMVPTQIDGFGCLDITP